MTNYSREIKPAVYSARDLENLTIAQIKSLAADLGYSLTSTKKADLISDFIERQGIHEN